MNNAPVDATWLIDLDGVIWLANDPIAGSKEAVAVLKASGRRVAFFTNNSFSTRTEMHDKFARHGIDVEDGDLLSSSQAAAAMVEPGSFATVLGGEGIVEALELRGVNVIALEKLNGQRVDAVFVGLDRHLTFERLTNACQAIAAGARFFATNDDATYPTPDGVLPGGGAVVAAIAYTTRVQPVVAGKPYPAAIALAKKVLGEVSIAIGDRSETDGDFGRGLGALFGMVRSGVTPAGQVVDPPPDFDGADLAEVVAHRLGMTREQILSTTDLHS
jgi:4-nitrophenyl phosphatase